ncbi:polysaccharide export protein Wza [Anaerohalosphaera lusitana]|uniref:Polysaccharide export protein Wza n=1 Tax=Anaerohalosphaera lusitana TaxID=1936003 RepID=A0A1U9NNU2_9BACT|nr:polysaccharide biosynthesis/export family protein [Anaerohalosphaera lusitana]AQT69467.1 polysaccharide export protein Wza [Anaerohalosphaera lusitana]
MKFQEMIISVILVPCLILTTGCFSSNPEDINAFLMPDQAEIAAQNYLLRPPDRIVIHCTSIPELHEQEQAIRPDGKIAFQDIGELKVAGKTPNEVSGILKDRLSKLYKLTGDIPVDVRVAEYRSAAYYVFGEVNFPGAKPFTGRDTVLSAISKSRPTGSSWSERVQIIRPSSDPEERPKIFEVNLNRMLAHGDTSKNVLLQEGDMIYVPPTILAASAEVIEEIVRPVGRAFAPVNITQTGGDGGF